MTQFKRIDKLKKRKDLKTSAKRSNFTLVSGGYIITIKPIAKGQLVVPVLI